jgi:ubiquinone/menaquinone biosynthesis C-methylase UbiE
VIKLSKENSFASNSVYSGIKGQIIILGMGLLHNNIHGWFVDHININVDDDILDAGCGNGQLVKKMSEKTKKNVTGIDYSKNMVKKAQSKNRNEIAKQKVTIIQASVSDLPFENEVFNKVTAFETINFWPDLQNDMVEIKRVIKEKGEFLIMNRLAEPSSKWYEYSQLQTPEEYSKALKECGFRNVETDTVTKKNWIIVKCIK